MKLLKISTVLALVAGVAIAPAANAKGCLRGAAGGAAVGHMAGHHAAAGAAGGCAVTHHHYAHKKKVNHKAHQQG